MPLYDYLYADLGKIVSLYSQLTGGVVEVVERNTERSQTADNKRNYDFKVFKHDAGGTSAEKTSSKETTKPHHALFTELEMLLEEEGYLVNLTSQEGFSLRDVSLRARLKNALCIKVKGRAIIEDYERLKSISKSFPEITKFVNQSAINNLKSSAPYIELKNQVEVEQTKIRSIKNREQRSEEQGKIAELNKFLQGLESEVGVASVPPWILEGLEQWINSFVPGIINLRVYPNTEHPDEHIFGNLKAAFLEDQNTTSFHFTYGSFPTEELTMLGIITSIPNEEGELFKPLAEFEKDGLPTSASVEQGFRGVFRGFDGIEDMIRTCRFPRVLVHPLTVYRSVSPVHSG